MLLVNKHVYSFSQKSITFPFQEGLLPIFYISQQDKAMTNHEITDLGVKI